MNLCIAKLVTVSSIRTGAIHLNNINLRDGKRLRAQEERLMDTLSEGVASASALVCPSAPHTLQLPSIANMSVYISAMVFHLVS